MNLKLSFALSPTPECRVATVTITILLSSLASGVLGVAGLPVKDDYETRGKCMENK